MAIQVEQRFPKCDRCGVMIHASASPPPPCRRSATRQFCSERCRDEYAALTALTDRGDWVDGASVGGRRLAS